MVEGAGLVGWFSGKETVLRTAYRFSHKLKRFVELEICPCFLHLFYDLDCNFKEIKIKGMTNNCC